MAVKSRHHIGAFRGAFEMDGESSLLLLVALIFQGQPKRQHLPACWWQDVAILHPFPLGAYFTADVLEAEVQAELAVLVQRVQSMRHTSLSMDQLLEVRPTLFSPAHLARLLRKEPLLPCWRVFGGCACLAQPPYTTLWLSTCHPPPSSMPHLK